MPSKIDKMDQYMWSLLAHEGHATKSKKQINGTVKPDNVSNRENAEDYRGGDFLKSVLMGTKKKERSPNILIVEITYPW